MRRGRGGSAGRREGRRPVVKWGTGGGRRARGVDGRVGGRAPGARRTAQVVDAEAHDGGVDAGQRVVAARVGGGAGRELVPDAKRRARRDWRLRTRMRHRRRTAIERRLATRGLRRLLRDE